MTSLLNKPLLVLDGGLGTTIEDQHQITFSSATPLWSSHLLISSPETLSTIQRDFAESGADVIITATYQASFEGFANTKVGGSATGISRKDAERYMRLAVDIASSAFQGREGLVALSLGAYGATMVPSTEYSGEYGSMTDANLLEFHQDRLNVFSSSEVWSKVDLIAIETLPRLDEVRAAREAVRRAPEKPYWISCVFPSGETLPDGSPIEAVLRAMLEGSKPPFAIGLNCTKVHRVADLILRFEEASRSLNLELPRLVLYPDGAGGKIYDTKSQKWIGSDGDLKPWDQQVHEIVQEIQTRGMWKGLLVGGCCKTTPQHIAKLKKRLESA